MFKNHDLWLWACLGVFGYLAARTCHKQLSAIRAATEVSPDEDIDVSENDKSRKDPSLESLTRLALGPNTRAREAAARVIEDIVLRRQTCDLMLDHIAGKNVKPRDEALVCLRFIVTTKRLNYPYPYIQSCDAVLKCLSHLYWEAYDFETAFRETSHGYRTTHYSNALTILIRLLKYSTNYSGLLPWLESYPFGGFSDVKDKKKSIQRLMSETFSHEPMYAIMLYAFRIPIVKSGLIRCNLVDREMVDKCRQTLWIQTEDLGGMWSDGGMFDNRGNITSFEEDLARSRVRARGGSFGGIPEERDVRRRRREAVLVGEAGRPIEAEDIFVPTYDETITNPPSPDLGS